MQKITDINNSSSSVMTLTSPSTKKLKHRYKNRDEVSGKKPYLLWPLILLTHNAVEWTGKHNSGASWHAHFARSNGDVPQDSEVHATFLFQVLHKYISLLEKKITFRTLASRESPFLSIFN